MSIEPIGYTYSDGSALCPDDAEVRGFEDEDNETGEAGAIFSINEASHDITCDVCRDIILEQNIEDEA